VENKYHYPVMWKEVLNICIEKSQKIKGQLHILDCTFGAGGHSKLFLDNGFKVSAIDQDINVAPIAEDFKKNYKDFQFFQTNFSNFNKFCTDFHIIFADLGFSSIQLDGFLQDSKFPNRGFSFMYDGILDMRMGEHLETPLKDIINKMPVFQMEKIIKEFGEERSFRKIANNIAEYRQKYKIESSLDLRTAIGIDNFSLLAKVFQAFRVFINKELEELEVLLKNLKEIENIGALIITFHSLEGKIVKKSFKKYKNSGFLCPTKEEILENPRSRSAILRYYFK